MDRTEAAMAKTSAQRHARHQGTGVIWDANHVDSTNREGPWECVVEGCPVVYSGHRRPSQRFRGTTPDPISGSFIIRDGAQHDLSLPHERIPSRGPAGQRDTESRQHIHRLTGLALPALDTPTQTQGVTVGASRTHYEYGYPIDTVEGLVAFQQAIDLEPQLALTERIRFGDTTYTWAELAYPATQPSFVILRQRIRSQVNPGQVYFIQGVAKYGSWQDNFHPELRLLRVLDALGSDEEIWVFMPNDGEFLHTSSVVAGQSIAVVANELVLARNRPALMIRAPHQIKIAPSE